MTVGQCWADHCGAGSELMGSRVVGGPIHGGLRFAETKCFRLKDYVAQGSGILRFWSNHNYAEYIFGQGTGFWWAHGLINTMSVFRSI
jgi:hypothetical protein